MEDGFPNGRLATAIGLLEEKLSVLGPAFYRLDDPAEVVPEKNREDEREAYESDDGYDEGEDFDATHCFFSLHPLLIGRSLALKARQVRIIRLERNYCRLA